VGTLGDQLDSTPDSPASFVTPSPSAQAFVQLLKEVVSSRRRAILPLCLPIASLSFQAKIMQAKETRKVG
jgi:hypothetical protein